MSTRLPPPARRLQGAPPSARRWAISFADMALLIACTLMLGWRPAASAAGESDAAASMVADQPVAAMFVPGEAMLTARGVLLLAPAQRVVAGGGRVRIAVGMGPVGSRRLDAWELAAARTAVIARALARTAGSERVILAAPEADAQVRIAAVR